MANQLLFLTLAALAAFSITAVTSAEGPTAQEKEGLLKFVHKCIGESRISMDELEDLKNGSGELSLSQMCFAGCLINVDNDYLNGRQGLKIKGIGDVCSERSGSEESCDSYTKAFQCYQSRAKASSSTRMSLSQILSTFFGGLFTDL